jgi:hypothetical protein
MAALCNGFCRISAQRACEEIQARRCRWHRESTLQRRTGCYPCYKMPAFVMTGSRSLDDRLIASSLRLLDSCMLMRYCSVTFQGSA